MSEPVAAILTGLADPQWGSGDPEQVGRLIDELAAAKATIARMRTALIFYADRSRYQVDTRIPTGEQLSILQDHGKRAAHALSGDHGRAILEGLKALQQRVQDQAHALEQLQRRTGERRAAYKAALADAERRADEAERRQCGCIR